LLFCSTLIKVLAPQ